MFFNTRSLNLLHGLCYPAGSTSSPKRMSVSDWEEKRRSKMKVKELEKNRQAVTDFCKVAHEIHERWTEGGREALEKFFSGELGIPENLAITFAAIYDPAKPPAEICPSDALGGNWTSSKIFEELSVQFESSQMWPKNVLAWWIMRHVFGSEIFDFEIPAESSRRQKENVIYFPALPSDSAGNSVRFGLAALETAGLEGFPAHVVKKATKLKAALGDKGYELTKALIDAGCIFPPSKETDQLIKAVKRGLDGETVVITGTFCPDYAYEETGNEHTPYRYTFESVSGGVGLVAKQMARILPHLAKFFDKCGIRYEAILFIGDFEANSATVLQRVGRTKSEFIGLCEKSLDAFAQAVPQVGMKLLLFEQQWARERWKEYCVDAYGSFRRNDFGQIRANTGKDPEKEVVGFIAKANKDFYDRWYGRQMTMEEVTDIVLLQGSEYAAMGRILAEDFNGKPFIQIAGDRPKMQPFNSMYSDHPTICAKRVY